MSTRDNEAEVAELAGGRLQNGYLGRSWLQAGHITSGVGSVESRAVRHLLAAIFVLGVAGCDRHKPAAPRVTTTVQQSFGELKAALSDGDGETAVERVTPGTCELYERSRKLALDSSGTDFESVTQTEVLLVFQLRWLLDAATLKSMDGSGVFSWGVENGLVKKETLAAIELDKVQIEGQRAFATLRKGGKPVTDAVFEFQLHDGMWKLDMVKLVRQADRAFDAIRKRTGKTKTEFALYLLEHTHKQKMPPQILNGPLR